MRKGAITREAILKALHECDRIGRPAFLEAYGFKEAQSYVLLHDGREYDSKAIAGVAHKYTEGRALKADEFSGGRNHAVAWLKREGFRVRFVRNPDWSRDEIILACHLVMKNGWKGLDAGDPQVQELSRLLRALPDDRLSPRSETFRNPNGVARKTFDIATQHPEYTGKPTNGGATDRAVLAEFLARPAEMSAAAELIWEALMTGSFRALPPADDGELEEYSAPEGRLLLRRHVARERDKKLRQKKIDAVLRQGAPLVCEVCDFDFEAVYGDRGAGYIECHHVVPLHVAGEGRTKLSDLALICSNCHRMIHRRAPWPTPAGLRGLLETRRSEA
ncbi:HNH endonuclease [Streptomyces sp. NPDC015139]|uniref:HNH endonuclease n=1 Tax=Streptomyces sp. NPDC015139 TaxID=3364942 RepID=UPI0036FC7BEE